MAQRLHVKTMKKLRSRRNPFRQLQWRLTLSYTLVTVAALVVVEVAIFGGLLLLLNSDFLAREIVGAVADDLAPQVRGYLERSPPDLEGLNGWFTSISGARGESSSRITRGLNIEFDDSQQYYILDTDGNLLAQFPTPTASAGVGLAFDASMVSGLPTLLPAALAGERDYSRLYTTRDDGTLLIALPISGQQDSVLGVFVMTIFLPSLNPSTLRSIANLTLISVIPFTLAAGLIGAVFGFLTARGLSRRLGALTRAAGAWSQADFSIMASDQSADELGQLARRLNGMAEQLQNLIHARQELAALEERGRLARDLHDSVKQQLFAATMQIGAAQSLLPADPQAAKNHLAHAEQLARGSQEELATLIHELRPAALESEGLAAALREYMERWSSQTGIGTQLKVQGERPMAMAQEQALFRIAQEALANVARHSQAQTVELKLSWREGAFSLSIADDGRGFSPETAGEQGFGLHSMRERAEALGGRLLLSSEPGMGTRVTITLTDQNHAEKGRP